MIARLFLCAVGVAIAAQAGETAFRVDGGDEKLPWFQLKPGEFPPENSAHAIAGELISVDHINRAGVLRPDRTDAQRRGDWDLPHAFRLLPFGSVTYHGAPAELRDVPIGTHLHGTFYLADPKEPKPKAPWEGDPRVSGEATFNRAIRLEDDFSHFTRLGHEWQLDAIDREKGTINLTRVPRDEQQTKPVVYQITPSTRVWKQRGFGTLEDLTVGQKLVINITAATLKGPGRCVDIWLDPESRELARAQQLEVHRQFEKEHGLPGWIDEVDNAAGTVTVTLFGGFDPEMKKLFIANESVTAAVAEDNLRTWDQINDRKAGPIVEVQNVAVGPGNSGFRVKFKPALLLEGFRPKRIVRLWPAAWKVDDLPREERLYY
jgi:hypothetical protein